MIEFAGCSNPSTTFLPIPHDLLVYCFFYWLIWSAAVIQPSAHRLLSPPANISPSSTPQAICSLFLSRLCSNRLERHQALLAIRSRADRQAISSSAVFDPGSRKPPQLFFPL